jgi:hypothetical protein
MEKRQNGLQRFLPQRKAAPTGPMSTQIEDSLTEATCKLLAYCRANDWAGYDPYDALNSKVFAAVPLLDQRIPRIVLTQTLTRLPINLRPVLGIPKKQNPKALALFLSALIGLRKLKLEDEDEIQQLSASVIARLESTRSQGFSDACWGYSFPWQTRTVLVPSGWPNLVCTTFVANALFDVYDDQGDTRALEMALSAAHYLLTLYWREGESAGFAYPLPSVRSQVHNANFLAAALLARAYSYTGQEAFRDAALRAARCSAAQQQADGSWQYGQATSQRWIDNFHTGYNLCALRALSGYLSTVEFEDAIRRGFAFYREHFFLPDGSVRYFHDRTHPIDIHAVAQSILTLITFLDLDAGNLPLAHSVLRWALAHMWNERGFFYYRVLPSHTNRISYMRWSQAWMLLAMVGLLEASGREGQTTSDGRLAAIGAAAR